MRHGCADDLVGEAGVVNTEAAFAVKRDVVPERLHGVAHEGDRVLGSVKSRGRSVASAVVAPHGREGDVERIDSLRREAGDRLASAGYPRDCDRVGQRYLERRVVFDHFHLGDGVRGQIDLHVVSREILVRIGRRIG